MRYNQNYFDIYISADRSLIKNANPCVSDTPFGKALHHEIAHIAFCKKPDRETDRKWAVFYPRIKPYMHIIPIEDYCKPAPEELANNFGRLDSEEDEASVAEELIYDLKSLENRASNNPVLWKKVRVIKDFYKKYSGGKMNDGYWRDLSSGKVDESYWRARR